MTRHHGVARAEVKTRTCYCSSMTATATRYATCMLCEATCGLALEVDGEKLVSVRGDRDDAFSRGYICPKAAALDDVRVDPDRVLAPQRRARGGSHRDARFETVSWETALDEAATRIAAIRREHGNDSVALYLGNPLAHNYGGLLGAIGLWLTLGTRARYSATSLDQLPHMLASLEMFGHQAALPVPDVDRTEFFLMLGANPAVSNGSIMTAPGIAKRIEAIRARGGRVMVIDPRRTETADIASEHHFIRPGTDALFLMAMLFTLFEEKRTGLARLAAFTDGLADLERACKPFTPERVAGVTGISADTTRAIARDFASARRAVCYGRVGICTQEFGGLAAWLVVALNVVTGNLDAPGGAMFTTPAIDLVRLATLVGQQGSFGKYASRVSRLPEFGGELPVASLAEEIETPGKGQIRALVTIAGNPVLSAPNGTRLEKALATLDYMVSVDVYANETTKHANVILPTSFGLERDHYDLVLNVVAVRNVARYAPAIFARAGDVRDDWDALSDLARRIAARSSGARAWTARGIGAVLAKLGPRGLLDLLLRTGPHRLSLAELEKQPHGVDLGALEPRLPALLHTKGKRIRLAPPLFLADVPRLEARLTRAAGASRELASRELELIGRRQLRSNNSWMHNSHRLVKGGDRCTLLMHPIDAASRGLRNGQRVRVTSRAGSIALPLEVSNEIAPGVVSVPHGWGHTRPGVKLAVAGAHAGASVNDVTDETRVDALTGTASFSGVLVTVEASAEARAESSPDADATT